MAKAGTISQLPTPEEDEKLRVATLVGMAHRLHDRIEADKTKLDNIKELLVALGPGKYFSESGKKVTIVGASASVKPSNDSVRAAMALAKDKVGLIFTQFTLHKPVEGFREIARAVFTPARAEKIIALCEVPTAAQVRF